VNINPVQDKKTEKPKGYCFLGYENRHSTVTVLAVDNFNGIKVNLLYMAVHVLTAVGICY